MWYEKRLYHQGSIFYNKTPDIYEANSNADKPQAYKIPIIH